MTEPGGSDRRDDDEINLLDYWRVTWKWKWLIAGFCSISVISALVFGLLSPKIYESTATILGPQERGGSGLLSALGATGLAQQIAGVSIPSLTPNKDTFISILKSRTVAQALVDRFKLKDYYKAKHVEDATRALQGGTKISIAKEGVISIKVEDRDPKMAADLANAFTDELDRLVGNFTASNAGSQRRFIADQLIKAEKDLKKAEENMRHFQEQNRAYLVGDMANSMRLPGFQVPKVGLELARLTREQKIQEAVYTLLTQQLEQAKISEAQDLPVVQVLDPAVPAIYKSKPTIKMNMALGGAVSLFIGIFLAFFLEYIAKQRPVDRLKSQ